MRSTISRRTLLYHVTAAAAALGFPARLLALGRQDTDRERLANWTARLRAEGLTAPGVPLGRGAARVGELAAGAPYVAGTLDEYLKEGGTAAAEPLTLALTRFDCVTLVEACLAVGRVAANRWTPAWERFGREVERMRYRGGERKGYASRLHYFSEWIADGAERGLVRDLGLTLDGMSDSRPLRFMTEHRDRYPALADAATFQTIEAMERRLDQRPRRVVPTERIREVMPHLETGDVLAFATATPGLDVTHAAFAYRDDDGVLLAGVRGRDPRGDGDHGGARVAGVGGRTGGRADGRTGGRADGRTGGRADGRTGGRADGRTGGPRIARGVQRNNPPVPVLARGIVSRSGGGSRRRICLRRTALTTSPALSWPRCRLWTRSA